MLAKALAHYFEAKLLLLDVTDFSLKVCVPWIFIFSILFFGYWFPSYSNIYTVFEFLQIQSKFGNGNKDSVSLLETLPLEFSPLISDNFNEFEQIIPFFFSLSGVLAKVNLNVIDVMFMHILFCAICIDELPFWLDTFLKRQILIFAFQSFKRSASEMTLERLSGLLGSFSILPPRDEPKGIFNISTSILVKLSGVVSNCYKNKKNTLNFLLVFKHFWMVAL